MITILILGILLVIACVMVHFEGLTAVNRFIGTHSALARKHLVSIIVAILGLHLIEIIIFSVGIYVAHHVLHLGDFQGDREFAISDYFHFSAETFTTVGYGDLYPIGPLRVLSSFESLTGILLIAWSGAFSYFTVQKLWDGRK